MSRRRHHIHYRNQHGWLGLAFLVTMGLTGMIAAGTMGGLLATHEPLANTLDKIDRNEATPEDMDKLERARANFARDLEMAFAGGTLVGSSGPLPNADVAELVNVAKSFYDDKIATIATHGGSTSPSKTGAFQPAPSRPGATVELDRWAWRRLVGTWRAKNGAEMVIKEDSGALTGRHHVVVGTAASYGVKPGNIMFMSLLPLKGNPLILHSDSGWVWPSKTDCPRLIPNTDCSVTVMVAPDYDSFRMHFKAPRYWSKQCKWALTKPWFTETTDWKKL